MSRYIEIEFKNMLTEAEFRDLINHFSLADHDFKLQKNYYFETPEYALKNSRAALRIREKQGRFVLTLKEERPYGNLETSQPLLEGTARAIIRTGRLPEGPVLARLKEMGVDANKIRYIGKLETERAEVPYAGGLIVLDRSSYFQKIDFEVEYEVDDPEAGKEVFHALLQELQIPERKSANKIARFFSEMNRLRNENWS